jgi:peptidoglycan glycosyltransferase
MNKPLRRVALAMMVMVVLLMANATYVQVINANSLRNSPGNMRTIFAEYSQERGQIIAGGQPLATSVPTQDKLKYLRTYPAGPAFAPLTGYYSFVYGTSGVENAQNNVLNGSDDSLAFNRLSDMVTGQTPKGGNVDLTINPAMQQAAYEGLTSKGFQGSVVALNPKTGAILAMANAPSYDPNPLAGHDSDQVDNSWKQLNSAPGQPMMNRAVSELYPPGSTFKLIDTAAALQGGFTPSSTVTTAPSITLPNSTTQLPNFDNETCPGNTLTLALAYSCNTAYAEVAGQVGPDRLRQTAAGFGFGQDLQVPMPVTKSDLGPMPDAASVYQSGIGQRDVRVTPMQNAMVTAAIANGGALMKPQLVQDTKAPDLSVLQSFQPQKMNQAIPPTIAQQIKDMMLVTEQKTSGAGKIPNVQIASKTGTAQHGADTNFPDGWYVAFGPAQDPTIAVAVIVENGGDKGANAVGATIAAPIGRAVIRAGLQGGS